jgi:hypothetical protein
MSGDFDRIRETDGRDRCRPYRAFLFGREDVPLHVPTDAPYYFGKLYCSTPTNDLFGSECTRINVVWRFFYGIGLGLDCFSCR